MKKIFFSLLIISNFLFSSGFNLSYSQKNLMKETLKKLYNQGIETSVTYKLLNYSNLEGGWESSEYKYIYGMKTSNNDRIAIFIFEDIYNYNNSIVTSLNIKKDFILLVDVNADPKVIWSGYLNNSTNNQLIGIDVSKFNGSINWEAVKSEGISFAYIKATQGYADASFPEYKAYDSTFITNMNGAINNNILVGAYHLVYPDVNKGNSEAIKEANYFISKIKPYYKNHKLLPPMIDLEKSSSYYSKQTLTDWVKTFGDKIENQLGVKPIIYMNEDYSDHKVYLNQLPYKLWIAKYKKGVNINTIDELKSGYPTFKPNKDYLFWQFTETASDISGIGSTYVDKDLFNGSIDDLKKLLVQATISNTQITYVQPNQLDAETEDITIILHGSNFSNVSNVFIEGIQFYSFTTDSNNQITIHASKVYGANAQYSVPVGYRKIILKFYDGTKVSFDKKIYVKEKESSYISSKMMNDYVNTVLNQCIDMDGSYGCQCMDLMHHYVENVLGIPRKVSPLVSYGPDKIWNNTFKNKNSLTLTYGTKKVRLDKVPNTATSIPHIGDIIIWKAGVGGSKDTFGHVAMFISGDVKNFKSIDQNWYNPSYEKGSPAKIVTHTYNYVLGYLRPILISQ